MYRILAQPPLISLQFNGINISITNIDYFFTSNASLNPSPNKLKLIIIIDKRGRGVHMQ